MHFRSLNVKLKSYLYLILLSFFSVFYSLSLQAAKLPSMPFPDDERVIIVADYMIFNGVPMSAFKIDSDKSAEEFLMFYKQLWSKEQEAGVPGYQVLKQEGSIILSRVEKAAMYSIQVEPQTLKGIKVTLGVSLLPSTAIPALGKGFPLMNSAKVMNDIVNFDGDMKARTLLIESSSSLRSSASFYERAFLDMGWSQMKPSKESDYPQEIQGDNYGLMFSKNQQEVQIVFSKNKSKTNIVALVHGLK